MKHWIIGILAAAFVAGGDKGTWVDVPMLCGFVQQMEKEGKATNDPSTKETIDGFAKLEGQTVCGRAGKSYTGIYDCEDGRSRVKCE